MRLKRLLERQSAVHTEARGGAAIKKAAPLSDPFTIFRRKDHAKGFGGIHGPGVVGRNGEGGTAGRDGGTGTFGGVGLDGKYVILRS